jgi:hypothetical protein
MQVGTAKTDIGVDPVNAIRIYVVFVKTQFVGNVQSDQKEAAQADCQAGNVDERKSFVLPQVPDGDL